MNIPWMRDYNSSIAQELMEYEKLEIAVKQLTGYDFKCLYELFRMGWTLERPKNPTDLSLYFSEIIKASEK
jgi:hypothetical protein